MLVDMKKRPEKFNYKMIQDVASHTIKDKEALYLCQDFAIVHGRGGNALFRHFLGRQVPLLIDDYRMGIVLKGDVHSSINLIDRHVTTGSILFLTPGSIVQPISVEGELLVMGVAVFGDMPFTSGRVPQILNGGLRDFVLKVDNGSIVWLRQLVGQMWQLVHRPQWSRETFMSLLSALVWFYDDCYSKHASHVVDPSHSAELFTRFIALVNAHCRREHQLAFYADRLCLTQRHLGVVIKQVSGVTAKEWIDRALIAEAKVMLQHTDKTVVQIADALNFANPSFFSKFFKRLTSLTPLEYRMR